MTDETNDYAETMQIIDSLLADVVDPTAYGIDDDVDADTVDLDYIDAVWVDLD